MGVKVGAHGNMAGRVQVCLASARYRRFHTFCSRSSHPASPLLTLPPQDSILTFDVLDEDEHHSNISLSSLASSSFYSSPSDSVEQFNSAAKEAIQSRGRLSPPAITSNQAPIVERKSIIRLKNEHRH